ncbi:MAG: hypothetical protein EOP09_00440 [Proteobacteria bacterium]|nr:MAG: hypothetical protein EOP09_00440 [Pseudomonadota bacterium]
MQHRSVWTASLCMVLCILLFDRSGRKQAFRGVSLAVGALTLLLTLGSSTPVARALASSADRAIAQEDTVEWRYQSWDAMMSPAFMGGTINYVIGRPRGESLARRVGNQTVDVQAHNYYVTLVELVGLAGLLANLIILGFMVPSFIKSDGIARGLSIVLIGQFVYWVSYGQTPELALLIGIAYSLWRQQGIVSPRTLLAKGR